MITEQHEFISARFSDNERKTIEVLWVDPETKEIVEEYIQVRLGDAAYDHLLKFISIEEIHEATKVYLKEQTQQFRDTIKKIAEDDGLLALENNDDTLIDKFNNLLFSEKETNKEYVFQIKLKAFELDFVKECKNRTIKSKLRKAETAAEIYTILFEINDLKSKD